MSLPTSEVGAGLTLSDLAELVQGRAEGTLDRALSGVGSVEDATPDQVALLSSKRYAGAAEASGAGAFLASEAMEAHVPAGRPYVVVGDAHLALVRLLRHFHPAPPPEPGVHPTAVLGEGARLGEGVSIGPYAVVGDGAAVGDRTSIGAHVVLGRGSRVGARCTLHPHVVLYDGTEVGDEVIVHSGARLGSDGFGYVYHEGVHEKIPHVGSCVIEDGVEIGANATVDRGSIGRTVVGKGAKIDNLVQVAHNVRVGALSLLAALVGVAGSTRVGRGVWMGGQAGVINNLDIGDGARLAAASKVYKDIPAGETFSGHPARPHREELHRQAQLARVPRIMERLKALEAEVEGLRERLGG